MTTYILKRLLSGILLLFIFVSAVFFLSEIILPGDFVSQFALFLSPKEAAELRQQLGVDLPLWQRYFRWVFNLIRGDLGNSYDIHGKGSPVIEVIKSSLPATLLLFGLGSAIAFLIGQWLGKVSAWKGEGIFSSFTTFSAILLYTSFPPWMVFLLAYFIFKNILTPSVNVRSLSSSLRIGNTAEIMWLMLYGLLATLLILWVINLTLKKRWRVHIPVLIFIPLLSLGWLLSWYLFDIFPLAKQIMGRAMLPLLAYVLLSFGEIMLIMRTTMLDVLHEEYIQTARAKGLSEAMVREKHAARNAILPVISRLVISLPYLLTGMVMVESVLGWPGVGTTLFYAVGMQNVPLSMGFLIVIGLLSLLARLFLDILQAALDPRVRIKA